MANSSRRTDTLRDPEPVGDRLAALNDVLRRWFYNPDFQAIRVLLGTINAHYLSIGDPAWLFLVAPPGTGKTTMAIMSTARLPQTESLGGFTANTFLSGFHGQRQPGLLEKLGETTDRRGTYLTKGNAIFLAKDFTTVLSMRRETRAEILAQLREIHDGEFRKSFGTGETKIWRGRVTLIAAVTPIIDRYYSVFTVLGERFLQLRWHRPDSPKAGQLAIRQQGYENTFRQELRLAVKAIFNKSLAAPPAISPNSEVRLAALAELVAIARTHIIRSSYGNREIEYVPEAEANTRISKGLAAIAKGIAALNGRKNVVEQDLQDAFRVGIDSVPETRRKLLLAIVRNKKLDQVLLPRTVKGRELEELENLGLITDEPYGLTETAGNLFATADIVSDGVRLI